MAVRVGVSQLGAHGFPSFSSFPLSTPFLSPFHPLSPPLPAHGSRTARARLATARARLTTVPERVARFYLKNSTLVYHSTLFKNNLFIKKLDVIMLIYVFFTIVQWGRCVGVGVWVIGWAMGIRGRPPRKFKKACGRQCEPYPNSPI